MEFLETELTQANLEVALDSNQVDLVKEVCGIKQGVRDIKVELKRMHQEFQLERSNLNDKMDKILNILHRLHPETETEVEMSESLLKEYPHVKKEPFVSITLPDGTTRDIFFNDQQLREIMSATKERELVRKLLLILFQNDIAKLRTFTLTGKSKKKNDVSNATEDSEVDYSQLLDEMVEEYDTPSPSAIAEKTRLPIETVTTIEGAKVDLLKTVVMKLFPPDHASDQVIKLLKNKIRTLITASLNYFHCKYNANGMINTRPKLIAKKKLASTLLEEKTEEN